MGIEKFEKRREKTLNETNVMVKIEKLGGNAWKIKQKENLFYVFL